MIRLMIAVGIVASAAVFSGLAPAQPADEKAKKPLVVGFAQEGAESEWRKAETKSVKEEAQKRGVTLKFSDAQEKQPEQIRAVRDFVRQKVDAIILAPKVETGWDVVLAEAKRAGIPVILVDRGVTVKDESLYATLIASDFVEEGKMAAEWLAKKMDGKGNVVELQGTTGSAPAEQRKKGFAEELAKHAGMKITKSQSGDFSAAKGKQVMEAFLKAERGNINAVYAHNDDMALGAIQAIEEAGLMPGKDIVIISIDGVKAAFEAMVAGKLNATVECNPLLGPAALDAVENVLAGKAVPKYIKSVDKLYEQNDAAGVIGSRKY